MDLGNLSAQFLRVGCMEEAEVCFRALLADRPHDEQALLNYATLCRIQNRLDESINLVERYFQKHGDKPLSEAWLIFGLLCEDFGKFEEAAKPYGKCLAMEPGHQNAAIAYGSALMRLQSFDLGFHHWDYGRFMQAWQPVPGMGMWNGADLKGKRLLVIREGGYGDGIMFARWIPKLMEAGAKEVGYFVWDCLHPLLSELNCQLIGEKESIEPEDWDFCTSLLSLPRYCGMHSLADIPESVTLPFMELAPRISGPWSSGRPKSIGLCWAAEENGQRRRHRSMTLEDLEPLKDASAIFCSLCPETPVPSWIRPHTTGFKNWAADARLIAGLDLVITVDTAVAHLAGSMGVPTWVMLPMNSSWQWFVGREDSPFYPSVRLFRQKHPIAWTSLVEEVRRELSK